jgi:hypothetical protein
MASLTSCHFTFDPAVPIDEVAATFELARFAAEALHGSERVALDAIYKVDADARTIEVDRSTSVGATLALVFLGYARREFGAESFRMRRVDARATTKGVNQ